MLMRNSNDLYAVGTSNSVIDHVANHREISIIGPNVVAGISEVRNVCQLMEGVVELLQVLVALISSPPLLGESSNSLQIIFCLSFKLEGGL